MVGAPNCRFSSRAAIAEFLHSIVPHFLNSETDNWRSHSKMVVFVALPLSVLAPWHHQTLAVKWADLSGQNRIQFPMTSREHLGRDMLTTQHRVGSTQNQEECQLQEGNNPCQSQLQSRRNHKGEVAVSVDSIATRSDCGGRCSVASA